MKTFIRNSCICIMSIFLYSCSEKGQDAANDTLYDNYVIELDNDYTFHKITHTDHHGLTSIRNFEYSDNHVRIYSEEGGPGCLYYLNSAGLADSSCYGKFYYDPDGYLIKEGSGVNSLTHQYSGGNRIKTIWGTNKMYFTHNTLINLLDIHNLQGSFLGRPGRNLISSVRLEFLKASNGTTINYQYKLNSEGLVTRRTGVRTNNDGSPGEIAITDFEYIKVSSR